MTCPRHGDEYQVHGACTHPSCWARYVQHVVSGSPQLGAIWPAVVELGGEEDVLQDALVRLLQPGRKGPLTWRGLRWAILDWLRDRQRHAAEDVDDELLELLAGSVGDALDTKASSAWGEIWASPYRTVLAREVAEHLGWLFGELWVLHLAGVFSVVDMARVEGLELADARARARKVIRAGRYLLLARG